MLINHYNFYKKFMDIKLKEFIRTARRKLKQKLLKLLGIFNIFA